MGLKVAKDQMFIAANGDRETVPNIAVMITDGRSSHNDPDARDNDGNPYKVRL